MPKVSEQVKNVFVVLLIAYVLLNLAQALWRNYKVERRLNEERKAIEDLKADIDYLRDLTLYYQTPEFKELEARRRLELRGPGEKVVILPQTESTKTQETTPKDLRPNYQKWWAYFFGKQ